MKSQVILTVEHGEDTDGLERMIGHILSEYDEGTASHYPGRAVVVDYEVKVDDGWCPECGGRFNRHFLGCSVWTHNQDKS